MAFLLSFAHCANSVMLCCSTSSKGLPQGKMLDIAEVGPVDGFDVNLKGTNSYEDIRAPTSSSSPPVSPANRA